MIASASVMCMNLGRLEEELSILAEAGIDEFHFDIMDGAFVPNFTLGPDFVRLAKRVAPKVHCNAHLMIQKPERYITRFVDAGCDSVSVHVETCIHGHRVLGQIRAAGASPGIAINPATPLTKLNYLLPMADRVLVMTVDPGYAGQKIIPTAFERVRILRENIRYSEYNCRIEVDGNIDVENGARLLALGADTFVLGTASIFTSGERDLAAALPAFRLAIAETRHLV